MTDTNTNGTPGAVTLKRYTFHSLPDRHSEDGRWVQYSDALAAIAAAEQRGFERAREAAARVAESHSWIGCDASADEIAKEIRALAFPPASGSEAKEEQP